MSIANSLANSLGNSAAGGAGEAPFVGVLDSFVTAPLFAVSMRRRMLAAHEGPSHNVRRTTGGDTVTVESIGFDEDGLLDTADLAATVGAQSWVVPQLYEQVGARHPLQITTANQPRGGTTGTAVTLDGHHGADFDGSNDHLQHTGTLGISGAVALSAYAEFQVDATFPYSQILVSLGAPGAGTVFSVFIPNATTIGVSISGASRSFTAPSLTSGTHSVLVALAAGAGIGTVQCWVDGVALAQSAVSNGSNTLNLGTTGIALGNIVSGTNFSDVRLSEVVVWNADFGHASLASDRAKAIALAE